VVEGAKLRVDKWMCKKKITNPREYKRHR